MKAIILGSDRGIRHVDGARSYPIALLQDRRGTRVLDWTQSALSQVGVEDVVFVGGYHIEKVVHLYSGLRFFYNPRWETGSDVYGLSCASAELSCDCLIVRSDVVFRPQVARSLLDASADVVVGIRKPKAEAQDSLSERFAGIARLSAAAALRLKERVAFFSSNPAQDQPPKLIQLLLELGLPAVCLDVSEGSAEIEGPHSLSQFVFGTKAQTLERLKPLVTQAVILDQRRFTVGDWRHNGEAIAEQITVAAAAEGLVVRSSALSEDSWTASGAGKFRSELGVDGRDRAAVCSAVQSVIASFEENGSPDDLNEVFVQPHLHQVTVSGVLVTRDPASGGPYIIVNYDDQTRRTDSVTSGRGEHVRTKVISKRSTPSDIAEPHFAQLLRVVSELEELSGHDALDLEFAFDADGTCYLFQVRPLLAGSRVFESSDADVDEELTALRRYVDEMITPHPHLDGDTTILANMPDWNPAEIVGSLPRPLALSLYQHIITDSVWGQARARIGYRDTHPQPLVVSLAGHPYVDTRASLNSFMPACIEPQLAGTLVNHCLAWLRQHPEFHDKLEFEVALTCLDFDFQRHRTRLLENGFTRHEVEHIRGALLRLTNDIVTGAVAPIEEQLALVDMLAPRRDKAMARAADGPVAAMRAVDFLLKDCIRFGTLPFSILARYAFISTSFLRSLRARNLLTQEEIERLSRSIPSVATTIMVDLGMLSAGLLSHAEFLRRYGHLRPGTYDILSPSYSEAPDLYIANQRCGASGGMHDSAMSDAEELFAARSGALADLIAETGFTFSVAQLQRFVCASIPAREGAKFEYTKNLSAALDIIADYGQRLDLSRDDLSFVPIHDLISITTNSPSTILKQELNRTANVNRKRYAVHKAIKLPHMITGLGDLDTFDLLQSLPNFVTSKRIAAAVVNIDAMTIPTEVAGRIALIESADPGYDWLFGRGIAGLITKYGGTASHMTIRAAELGLPAAIGCGELIYSRLIQAHTIELDCAAQQLRVLR